MAYHAGLGGVVLFGGRDGAGNHADTWIYDGAGWSPGPVAPLALAPRYAHSMAYDSTRDRTVLVGGTDGTIAFGDTWELAPAAWLAAAPVPSAMQPGDAQAMAYDSRRRRMVVFTGVDTWEYDGTAWTIGAASPAALMPRLEQGLAFDEARGVTVLCGGLDPGAPGSFDDAWDYDGVAWRPAPESPPGIGARQLHAASYDAARGRVVVFGGRGGNAWTDPATWELDGITWTKRGVFGPPARNGHAMAYDDTRSRTVLFGGQASGLLRNDTWELDGSGWMQGPAAPPGLTGRWRPALAYDAGRARTVLFGGYSTLELDDTWEYDGTAWTPGPAAPPALTPRFAHALAYDAARSRIVLFGGDDGVERDDTWQYDGAAWSPGAPAPPGLIARSGHVMAYDTARQRVLLYGGQNGSSYLDDAWELDGAGWTGPWTTPEPLARRDASLVYADALGGCVLFGGSEGSYQELSDTWITRCADIAPATLPPATVGATYGASLTGSGGTPPYTFAVTVGTLPPGLSLAPSGSIVGWPSAAGDYTFVVKVADGSGCEGSRAYTIAVACAQPTITIQPPALPAATVEVTYGQWLTATGGVGPYRFDVVLGRLPNGLDLAQDGFLAGTPLSPGTSAFTVRARDALSWSGELSYGLTTACPTITLAPSTLAAGRVGQTYLETLGASGGTAPYTFDVTDGGLPPGIDLGWGNGRLEGTPSAVGSFAFRVRGGDRDGCGGTSDYVLDVEADPSFVVGRGLGPTNDNRARVFAADGSATGVDFLAYGAGSWGTNVGAGEIDAGGHGELLTGPGPGTTLGPQARAFRYDGTAVAKVNFYAYGTLKYGVDVAGAALDGDRFAEIVTGAGPGAVFGPHVRAFDYDGAVLAPLAKVNFFAYGTLKYGVDASRGDVDGDRFAEILTGAGAGIVFAPHVRGFDYDGAAVGALPGLSFVAFSIPQWGANVASGDTNGSDDDEIAVTPGPGPTLPARFLGFDYRNTAIQPLTGFDVTPYATAYGGRVAVGDIRGGSLADLIASPGRDPAAPATVATFRHVGSSLVHQTPDFDAFTGGYGVNPDVVAAGY